MKTCIRLSLGIGILALSVGLTGCSDVPPPAPYRGEYMATLSLSPDLEKALVEKYGYDPKNNCVQLVGRDRTRDKIRHVDPVVIFSPDPCPTEPGKVADREAFLLDATREPLVPAGMGGGQYPALAYSLVLNAPSVKEVVGTVMLVDEIPTEQLEEAPKQPVYQLGDVCTLAVEHEEMCGLIFTHEGRFNQIDSNRAAVGRRKRDRRTVDGLKRHMDTMRNVLSAQLNDTQRNLITNVSGQLENLQNAVKNEQRMLAFQMVELLEARLDDLASEVNANQNAAAKNVLEDLRREVRALHAENLRVLRQEIRGAVTEVKAFVLDVQTQLNGRLGAAETALLTRITESATKLEANVTAHQRRTLLVLYAGLTADLDRLAGRLEKKIDTATTRQIRAIRQTIRKQVDQVLKAIREEVLAQAAAFEKAVEQRFGTVDQSANTTKETLLGEIRKITDSQTRSAALLADELPKLKEALNQLSKETGRSIDVAMERCLARLEAALDEETQASEVTTRSQLHLQLGAAKKAFDEQKVVERDAENLAAFDALVTALEKGGTPAEQLERTEKLRPIVVALAKAAKGELDEAQAAAIAHVRITLRDYAVTAMRLEHRALVRELLPVEAQDPRANERLKQQVPEFAAAKFAERGVVALKIAETIENDPAAKSPGIYARLQAYAAAVEAEQKLRSRDLELR